MLCKNSNTLALVCIASAGCAAYGDCELATFPDRPFYHEQWGQAVAAAGHRILVGVPGETDIPCWGAAYLFLGQGRTWNLEAVLTPADATQGIGFSHAVALNASGDLAVVGAKYDVIPDVIDGSVYVYERSPIGEWSQVTKLTANQPDRNPSEYDYFGHAVAVSGDRILAGAYNDTSAYIFDRNADRSWSQTARLTPGQGGWYFGYSVAINGDIALVGAPNDFTAGDYAGAAFVFERGEAGAWMETARLLPQFGHGQRFGWSVSLNGTTALISAPAALDGRGAAYVFERGIGGQWTVSAVLRPDDPTFGYGFGQCVALAADLAVICLSGSVTGSAYVFSRGQYGSWVQIARLATPDGGLSLGFDEPLAVVGAPFHDGVGPDGQPIENAGAAYVLAVGPDDDGDGIMDVCECLAAGDLDLSGSIGLQDLLLLLSSFGLDSGGDLDADGLTGLSDLTLLLSNFGEACP